MYSQLTPGSYRSRDRFGSADGGAEQLFQLALEVPEVWLRIHGRADGAPEELLRLVHPAVPVDVLAEPLGERRELAPLELIVEAAEVGLRALPQLNRDDVPERVRREVADAHVRPVHVLEHAVREVGWLQSEVLAHLRVEGLRQVAHLEAPGEELALDLEASSSPGASRCATCRRPS